MDPFDRGAKLSTRWFTLPAALAATAGIAAVYVYGTWMANASFPSRVRLGIVAVIGAAVSSWLAERRARRTLKTWKQLSEKRLSITVENLQRAVTEAYSLADKLFMMRLGHWGIAGLLIPLVVVAMAMRLGQQVKPEHLVRAAGIGFLVGPLVCLVPHFEMIRRGRSLVARIASMGLTPSQLAAAVPPTRLGLRGRLVIFGLVATAVPSLLVADVATGQAEHALDRVVEIQDVQQRRLAAGETLRAIRVEVVEVSVLMVLVIALLAAGAGSTIGDPVHRMAEEARRVSEGNLSEAKPVIAEGELWTLANAFVHMETQLVNLLIQLKRAGVQISSTTEQIVVTSSKHESGAQRQASALTQTSTTTEELARSAKSIASNAASVAEIAQKTLVSAEQARGHAVTFSEAMARMSQGNQAIAESVSSLNARLGQIGKIIEFINGIADKSEMLALNAELEGVKAGEVGRAFSLVATEMRKMAENVVRSTQEIVELIDEIRDASTEAVRVTEAGVRTTEQSAGIVEAVSKSLSTIVTMAGETSEAVKTISSATQQQQSGTDQLAGAMNDILSVTKETETATQAIILANVDLVRLAKDLQDAVERFEVRA